MQTNFGKSSSTAYSVKTISNEKKSLKRGEKLGFTFLVLFSGETLSVPKLTKIKLNGNQICPEKSVTECLKFISEGMPSDGQWNGSITVYPDQTKDRIKLEIELDEPALRLGVN